jgi:hypothetical protein
MIGSSRGRVGVLVLLAMAASAATARADAPAPVTPPTEAQVEAAKVPYREARELERQGKLKEALERALDAYHVASTPVTALQAGQLLAQGGQLVLARDILRSVALFPVSPRESDKGRESRQDAAALAATLDARIPKIALAARPTNVDVLLDGKAVAATDATAWQGVDPGAHTLVVRANDRVCTTINVTLTEAEARTIDLHDATAACRPEPAAATPQPVTPEVAAAPAQSRVSDVPAPTASTANEASSPPWRWAGAALGGAGAIAIGVGGYLALSAKSDYDGAASECPSRGCTQAGYDARESARSRADAATITMVVGAAALAGGALLFFLPGGSSTHAAVGVGPGSVRLLFVVP